MMVTTSFYGWTMLGGIVLGLVLWRRVAKRDERLVLIYAAALMGAFLGAKISYLVAEGWLHWHDEHRWLILATGKSITGALLGGFLAVEGAKRLLPYQGVTGDWFAAIIPGSIILGRVGCLCHGCCLGRICEPAWYTLADAAGVARWPAVPLEIIFNGGMLLTFFILRRGGWLAGQHFHVYLMAYGLFRFAHEFMRDTPVLGWGLSGYQVIALGTFMVGGVAFIQRGRQARDLNALPQI